MAAARESDTAFPAEKREDSFSHYYGMLLHQQNMLLDHVRTGTYQSAILQNSSDFKGAQLCV